MKVITSKINKGNIWNKIYTPIEDEKIVNIRVNNGFSHKQKVHIAINSVNPTDEAIASAVLSNIPFYSRLAGTEGNSISIEFIDPGVAGDLSITVTDYKISVTLASDGTAITSTLTDVISAIQNDTNANALVYIDTDSISSLSALATAVTETNLSGGVSDNSFYILKSYTISGNSYIDFSTNINLSKHNSIYVKSDTPLLDIAIALE